jgi:predicted aspartyl protease
MSSFTVQIPNLLQIGPVVQVEIAVGQHLEVVLKAQNQPIPPLVRATALIDTGASSSVISEDMAQRLNLQPIGTTSISTPSCHGVRCFEYAVRLMLPNSVVVAASVIGAPLAGQSIQCLIGRDILQHGVLVYIGYTNSFTLSF